MYVTFLFIYYLCLSVVQLNLTQVALSKHPFLLLTAATRYCFMYQANLGQVLALKCEYNLVIFAAIKINLTNLGSTIYIGI